MTELSVGYVAKGRDAFECRLHTRRGAELRLFPMENNADPLPEGDVALAGNPAVVTNLWAFGVQENLYRRARAADKRKSHRKQADRYAKQALGVANLVEQGGTKIRVGWCSACFTNSQHQRVSGVPGPPPAFLCQACGAPTARCAAPHCANMATRDVGRAAVPRYCAEHRHDIPSFERMNQRLASIADYSSVLAYDTQDFAKITKVVGGVVLGAIVIAPTAFLAAPAIGGAIGASALGGSLSGAAAVSHGLAMVGGGSLAAGGLGMAGGTVVITAVGGGLGGAMGAATTSAYVKDDKSFGIQQVREGTGTPVLLANGFLTEGRDDWTAWRDLVTRRYPEAPVYVVHWGSKERKELGALIATGAGKAAVAKLTGRMAASGSRRAAAKVPFLGGLLIAGDLLANPWHVAKNRADMTGAVLADILARTEGERFILIGHSLGGRVMATTARLLGTRRGAPRLETVHLLGAAVPSKGDWRTLNDSVSDRVWNYHSTKDQVLHWLYRYAQFGSAAAGSVGFGSKFQRIADRNVTLTVAGHTAYFEGLNLR